MSFIKFPLARAPLWCWTGAEAALVPRKVVVGAADSFRAAEGSPRGNTKKLRYATILPSAHGDFPRPARQPSGRRQSSVTVTAIIRSDHRARPQQGSRAVIEGRPASAGRSGLVLLGRLARWGCRQAAA